MLVTAWS